MSDYVGSVIPRSAVVENVKEFLSTPLVVFHGPHLCFRCWLMSGCVDSVTSKSGKVENVEVAVGIASPAVSVQKLFPVPVSNSGLVADT